MSAQLALLREKGVRNTFLRIIYRIDKDNHDRDGERIVIGLLERFDNDGNFLLLTNGMKIPIENIISLRGEIFSD